MKKSFKDQLYTKKLRSKLNKLSVYSGLIGVFIGIIGTVLAFQQLNISRQQQAVDLAEIKKSELQNRLTEDKYFIPATDQEINDKLIKDEIADCWTSSLSSSRYDAYRCSVGNLINDPCYAQDSHTKNNVGQEDIITCPGNNPNDRDSASIYKAIIKERNKVSVEEKKDFYWLIKLENGLYCRAYSGATGTLAGLGVSRGCTDGDTFKGLVLDGIEIYSKQQTTALYYDEATQSVKRLFVEELWQ